MATANSLPSGFHHTFSSVFVCFSSLNSLSDGLVALSSLVLVLHDVLLLKLAHSLDLIQVDYEALIVSMEWLDALPAENVQVVRAVKMLDTLWVLFTELLAEALLVLILEVKARACQYRVLLNHLVENIDVEGQTLGRLQLLDKLAADWASDTVLMVQLLDAVRAQSMATMDQDSWNAFANVVLKSTELANVKTTRLVV